MRPDESDEIGFREHTFKRMRIQTRTNTSCVERLILVAALARTCGGLSMHSKPLLNLHASWDDFSVDEHTGRRENAVTRDVLRASAH